ncbi:MAG: hypothetical protein R6X02_17605 [Enhygromyxa sp.]
MRATNDGLPSYLPSYLSSYLSSYLRASRALATLALIALSLACKPKGTIDPSIASIAVEDPEAGGAWAVHEALEERIRSGTASEADRVAALEKIRAAPDDQSAAYAYARASVAGRVAEGRGLRALKVLEEMRTWARRSIERDPEFEDMAATRMLGTLLALAGQHLDGGDSEEGLELLEAVVEAHPDKPINRLRLAEAYVALGDPEPGFEHLCAALAGRAQLVSEEQRLLDGLISEVGGAEVLACTDGGS